MRGIVGVWALCLAVSGRAAVTCPLEFAPLEGRVKAPERPYREEQCLNGRWRFQPVALPAGLVRDRGLPPELPPPRPDAWAATPIRIPSHWNVNTWGGGRRQHRNATQTYWPDSVYFPSYPREWDGVEMGWLRRTFRVPEAWRGRRLVLHFEAVSGACQVLVNGRPAGEHFDNFLPFDFDVTESVRWGEENELLVGIRGQNLFNKRSARYAKFLSPYPPGSNTDLLIGIWQDVSLLALPPVRVADTFVQARVAADTLEVEVTLLNQTAEVRRVTVGGEVCPWLNEAGREVAEAPVPAWRLGAPALALEQAEVALAPGSRATVTLRRAVGRALREWSPERPELYGLVLTVSAAGETLDRHYTRFGWRELALRGPDLLLNGRKVKLAGDFVHPFGVFVMSPRTVWAWYRMVKDMGGNAIRPHAQVHPRFYLELADEMGLLVLDETAVFGSSIRLNPEEPEFWLRYEAHYDGLVLRDRNHPSVMGWSFGNEMFAIPRLNEMSKEDTQAYYDRLRAIAGRSLRLDPTRAWITCDGDEDLGGALPVWSKHFGHGDMVGHLPKGLGKPLKVGESGGTYYATPEQLAQFNGDRAYLSTYGRNEALAIDLYDNIVRLALPHLSYFSPSEVVWFGLEHLNLGFSDFSRLPTEADGVFFSLPYQEGKPGMQPERLPPYVTTLNPGWDPALPLYKPLPMFHAMRAALALGGPQPCPWERKILTEPVRTPPVAPFAERAGFIGAPDSPLRGRLAAWGVPVAEGGGAQRFLVVDGQTLTAAQAQAARVRLAETLAAGGTVWILLCDRPSDLAALNGLLPEPVALTERWATQVQPRGADAWLSGLSVRDLYFAQLEPDRRIMKFGLDGAFVANGAVVLEASPVDWSLFNNQPEFAKVAAVALYERLEKPAGAAWVRRPHGGGVLALSVLDYRLDAPAARSLWRRLFANMGLRLAEAQEAGGGTPAGRPHDLLLNGPMP